MNYMRPVPKLIDPGLLGKVNKIYINKHNQNNYILEWLVNMIFSYFKDNFLFSTIVICLIGYLIYRYLENIRKKNRIIQNIDDEKPIPIKLEKPINYNNKEEDFTNKKKPNELSDISNLSEMTNLSSPKNIVFEKDLERELKIGNNSNQQLNNLPPELIRQQIMSQQIMSQQINSNPNNNSLNNETSLQQNMNQLKNPNQGCSNYKVTSLVEPTAGNAFSDNFMMF
jgi:hypothetical protein